MQEQTRQLRKQAFVIGSAMMLTGIVALTVGFSPGAADALVKFWPTGVIGVGVALLFGNADRR
jgi:energy-converting hydrogenase Eha subunit E